MPVELRWAIPASTTAERPRLQYRQCPDIIQFGGGSGWTEWQDVPYVVVPQEPPKPAPTVLSALGATVGGTGPAHNGHPMRHWDRTCPACNPEGAAEVPSGAPPSQAPSHPYTCPHCDQREGCAHGEWCRGAGTMVKRPAGVTGRVKCDGNHGGPRCADPECWNDDPDGVVTGGEGQQS